MPDVIERLWRFDGMTWIDWFLEQPRARFFVRIDDNYLSDAYNYYGIAQKVNHMQSSYSLMRKSYISPACVDMEVESDAWIIGQQAELLYGLMHARYLATSEGMARMRQRFTDGAFPTCPRRRCKGARCLPYGITFELNEHPVKLFCPSCSDVYNVSDEEMAKVDGAFFGPSWIHLFRARNPDIEPAKPPEIYVPRIFGVKVAET